MTIPTTTATPHTPNENPMAAAVTVRILMVGDGRISFDPHKNFGLGVLVGILRASRLPVFDVVTAHRAQMGRQFPAGQPIEADLFAFRFDRHDLSRYDQIWLFGDSPARVFDDGLLLDSELAALARFMDKGGGVFATGDHEDLGLHLCGKVPRVRSMRKWYFDNDRPPGEPRAPEQIGKNRHDTLVPGNRTGCSGTRPVFMFEDESDDRPQQLILRWYIQGEGSALGGSARPHPLLSGPGGEPIDVLPDHPHEGECYVPSDLTRTFQFDGYGGQEYPARGGPRIAPEVIATSRVIGGHETAFFGNRPKPHVVGRTFGSIGAYDGHRAGVGRVVVDSTWHHLMNWNLTGGKPPNKPPNDSYPCPAQREGFLFSEEGKRALAKIEAYFRNIGGWLIPAARRPEIVCGFLQSMAWSFPAAEFVSSRSLDEMSFSELLHVGEATLGTLSGAIGEGLATLCALDLIGEIEGLDTTLLPGLDPWAEETPESASAPQAARLLSAQARALVLGGALQKLAEDHPAPPEKALDAAFVGASVSAGVRGALEKLYTESERAASSLAAQARSLAVSSNMATATPAAADTVAMTAAMTSPKEGVDGAEAPAEEGEPMDWTGLVRHHIDLALPLIFIRGARGVLACGYFDVRTFDHRDAPMAGVIVRGVTSFEAMLGEKVRDEDISTEAKKLGIRGGMTGRVVLGIFRRAPAP
ncbi:MAG: DUF1805 domain-containing protein [Polyangiaceae bacterium]